MKRLRALLVGAVVVSATLVAPAAAHAAPPASAQWGSLDPSPGSSVDPLTYYQDSSDSLFAAYPPGYHPSYAYVGVFPPSGPTFHQWLYGPDDSQPTVGTYEGATIPFAAGVGGIQVQAPGLSCTGSSTTSGRYVVHEATYDGSGKPLTLAADWEVRCDGASASETDFGAIRYNSTYPTASAAPENSSRFAGTVPVGTLGDIVRIIIKSNGTASVGITAVSMAGSEPGQFEIVTDECTGVDLAVGATCEIDARATPTTTGHHDALVRLATTGYASHVFVKLDQTAFQPTSLQLQMAHPIVVEYGTDVATATVSPVGATGIVDFSIDGVTVTGAVVDPSTGVASAPLTIPALGTHNVAAKFVGSTPYGDSVSAPVAVQTKHGTAVTVTSTVNPVAVTEPVSLTATVHPTTVIEPPTSGTLSLIDETTSTTLASVAVTGAVQSVSIATSFADVGTHTIAGVFDGLGGDYIDATGTLNEVVGTDTSVNASGVTVSGSSIYPYHDGYRDTLVVRGVRNETVSVSIKVTSASTHKTVASASIPAGVGAYSWTWTGKWSTGALLPAGSYVIQQTLRDSSNNTLVVSRTVSLSAKRLYWHTGTVTIYGGSFQLAGTQPQGSHETITKQNTPYPHEVRIHVGNPGWVAVEYQVIEPAATAYGTITVYVKGKISGKAWIGVWNPALGAYKYIGSYDSGKLVGPGTTTWSTHATGPTHISARHVHVLVYIGTPFGSATMDVATVKVTYRYAILK